MVRNARGTKANRFFLASTAVVALAATSYAQPRQFSGRGRPHLSPATWLIDNFDEVDTNKDGTISRAELEAYRKTAEQEQSAASGQPASQEDWRRGRGFEERAAELLKEHPDADTNGDGQLSREEARAFFQQHPELRPGPRRFGQAEEGEAGGRGRGPRDEAAFRQHILEQFPSADLNHDGTLDDAEFAQFRSANREQMRKRLLERMPEADLNGDGTLSDEELATLLIVLNGHRPHGGRGGWGAGGGPQGGGPAGNRPPLAGPGQ